MEHNPYAPPKTNVDVPASQSTLPGAPTSRLYSHEQIGVATFLGTPLAGGWLMATNYRQLAQHAQATQALWWGVAACIALMVISVVLPDNFPNSVLPIAVAFGYRALADNKFGPVIKEHRAAGGPLFSWWRVVGIGFLCAAIVVAVVFGVIYALVLAGVMEF